MADPNHNTIDEGPFDFDVIVVGSGFGGSVTALRLTEKGYRVAVIEEGRRFDEESLPRTNWNLRRFLWFPRLGLRGIQRLTLLHDVLVLSGAGVGGGSLVYANALYEPHEAFYTDPQWGAITDWKAELAPFYALARRMLGSNDTPYETPADEVIKRVAHEFGVEDTFRATPVGVYFGEPGTEVPDPYFGGTGPTRTGCIGCGGCMVGCRHNAKNTLDKNYLYLAEANGATVIADRAVTKILPLPTGGYEVAMQQPGAWLARRRRRLRSRHVVLSAGALGTTRLLLRLKEDGSLPGLSERLGYRVRTNSEAILGASVPRVDIDYSHGVAITSSIHPLPDTHIEPVRYSAGSNVMGLLATILVDGGGRLPRQLRFLGQVIRHPVRFVQSFSVRRWSERTVILLVMQSVDNSIRLSLRGKRWRRLRSAQDEGHPNPSYIPVANQAARHAAAAMGGFPGSALNEVLLDVPTTAHILGGACVGDSPATGVIDPYQRVYGHDGLHVADGSAVSANLGVNPSLSIVAMTERAMALWPNRGETDLRPPVGEAYQRLAPIAPRRPAVPATAPTAWPFADESS